MGWLNKIVKRASLGTIKDFTGEEGAAKAATRANTAAQAAQEAATAKAMGVQTAAGQQQAGLFGQQGELYKQQLGMSQPWATAGLESLGQMQEKVGQGFQFDPTNDPVYQARLAEQSKAFGMGGSAKGMQLSGSALKGLRDITATELGTSFGRQYDQYQGQIANLGQIAGFGQNAMGYQMQAGANYGNAIGNYSNTVGTNAANMSNLITNQGEAQAQGARNLGDIQAAQSTSSFNNLMAIGKLGASIYGAGATGGVA